MQRYQVIKEWWRMTPKPRALFSLEHVKRRRSWRDWQGVHNEVGRKPGEMCYLTVFQEVGRRCLAHSCSEVPWVEHWDSNRLVRWRFTNDVHKRCSDGMLRIPSKAWLGWVMGEQEKRDREYAQLFGCFTIKGRRTMNLQLRGDLDQGRLCMFKITDATACLLRRMSLKRRKFWWYRY